MLKKICIVTTILLLMLTLGMMVFAESNFSPKADDVPYFELSKDLDGTKTFDKELVVSGRANEGTSVTLSMYVYKSTEESTPTLLKKTEDSPVYEWVAAGTKQWTVGACSIFARKINLEMGKNRLEFTVKDKDGNVKKQTVEITLANKEKVTQYILDFVIKDVEKNIKER